MKKQFVTYEIATKLSELGFNELCFCVYNRNKKLRFNNLHNPSDKNKDYKLTKNNGKIPAPLYQQVFDWFLETYKLYVIIIPTITNYWTFKTTIICDNENEVPPYKNVEAKDYSTYEEAKLQSIKKLIELCKNN